LRLLLVEDHGPTRAILERILVRDGHQVFAADSVHAALALAGKQECDAVITDIGLPDGTGIQLFSEIKERHGWPGIALSGYGMDEDLREADRVGFVTHLTKPVRPDQLRDAVARMAEQRILR
jgi:CheY-like chemotaxis protein